MKVYEDDELIFEEKIVDKVEIKRTFTSGNHVLKAIIENEDYFLENNEFLMAIEVLDKPSVLFVTKQSSPMLNLYKDFYFIDEQEEIPENLDRYYAIVLNRATRPTLTILL